mgnify:CR=1 FL=1|jgi:arsenate reductase-like glutaredoxin family protein
MPEDLILNDDVILPDDDAATAGGEGQQNSSEPAADTGNATLEGQAATQETPQETPQERQERLFRQEEVNRIVQERLAREKQRFEQELKSNPYLSYLEQIAQESGMSIDQLIENDRKFREQQKLNELIQKNIPEEYARKLLEHDKIMQQYLTEKQQREQKEKEQKMYLEFLEAYPDVKPEDVPVEVWKEVKEGRNLLDAYIRYENQKLKAEMAKFQQQQQNQQANQANAASSTGSARDIGSAGKPKDPFEEGFDDEI